MTTLIRFAAATSAVALIAMNVACSRETSVYTDPKAPASVTPVSTDTRAYLPKEFYGQSVNRATVEIQPDGVTANSKALRFQTVSGTSDVGGFNGSGTGNRAILGLGSLHGTPVSQAEPVTFDAKTFTGAEAIGVSLQIDLACDAAQIHVLSAAGSAIASETTSSSGDGYTRFSASIASSIWLARTAPILDPDNASILVPTSGTPVSLSALLAKYPAACLKNAATTAGDLPKGIPTAAVLWTLGQDSTTTLNSTFIRRLTVGSQVFEGLE